MIAVSSNLGCSRKEEFDWSRRQWSARYPSGGASKFAHWRYLKEYICAGFALDVARNAGCAKKVSCWTGNQLRAGRLGIGRFSAGRVAQSLSQPAVRSEQPAGLICTALAIPHLHAL